MLMSNVIPFIVYKLNTAAWGCSASHKFHKLHNLDAIEVHRIA